MSVPHVCPWWIGYLLASPVRKLVQDPAEILAPFVTSGMTVLEPGPGMGFFTQELARLVGPNGRVIAVDLQQRMLDELRRRVRKAGLEARLETRLGREDGMGVAAGSCDFALLFALVHEVPDQARFLAEVAQAMRPGSRALFCEPAGHVSRDAFERSLDLAAKAGLAVEARPKVWRSHGAVLVKPAG